MGNLKVSDGSAPLTAQNLNLTTLPSQILEENESISDIGFFNGDFEQTTTINVENSSDVVIGPVTQFHGPVTIVNRSDFQILPNGITLENKCYNAETKTELSVNPVSIISTNPIKPDGRCRWKFILIALALVLATVSGVAIFLAQSEKNVNLEPTNPSKTDISNKYITREVWGGKPPLSTRPLAHPTPYVLITHTVTQFCKTLQRCSELVRNIRSGDMNSLGSPDIGSNFLIGGDGNIYVGRGWNSINYHTDRCIAIAFIGDYTTDELTSDQIKVAKMLLDDGVRWNMLDVNYKLVNHNQTTATVSPGRNVYKETKTWDHFLDGSHIDFNN